MINRSKNVVTLLFTPITVATLFKRLWAQKRKNAAIFGTAALCYHAKTHETPCGIDE